nr:glycogen/starch/alpha-glucan phosphorylase [Lachnospiraceae bacterium]
KEASGTGNMKFMLNGAITLGTLDGANVEMLEEAGADNMVIFGLTADEVIAYEHNHKYDPEEIYKNDAEIKEAVDQLIDGTYSPEEPDLFRDLYDSLLNKEISSNPDQYFILKDFRSYAEAQKKIEEKYKDRDGWARSAMMNTAKSGKFSSDRTIEEYVEDIWHLTKATK